MDLDSEFAAGRYLYYDVSRIGMIESAEEFKRLRESENPEEYRRAAHEESKLSVWNEVIERFPEMRFWVAQNKTVPIEILRILSEDKDSNVRFMVASKRKINKEIKEILIIDEDSSIRAQLARNPKLEIEYLEILKNDPESFVREAALDRLNNSR